MAVIVFKLNGVPDDEANEVRALLNENHLDFYETSAGKWGFSIAAIWLKDNTLKQTARALIDDYQHARAARLKQEYDELQREGQLETFADRLRENPLQFVMAVVIILFVLYLSLSPFLDLGQGNLN